MGLYKNEALEITFQIYSPAGCGVENPCKSTRMNPIIDGQEARKLLGGSTIVAIKIVLNLVTNKLTINKWLHKNLWVP